MPKILLLSNGHGEDLSGSLLAKQLVINGNLVDALPIVGKGKNYEKEKNIYFKYIPNKKNYKKREKKIDRKNNPFGILSQLNLK